MISGRHDTPIEVAKVLAKHAPKNITSLLEPSVGTGALLIPFKNRLLKSQSVTCIDIDKAALMDVESRWQPILGERLNVVHGDFLKWSKSLISNHAAKHDCIVMNPPFSAKKSKLYKIEKEDFSHLMKESRHVPLEIAFIIRAIQLLKPHGRLLTIVPTSVISSSSTSWFRKILLCLGAIHYVHEMPPGTFPTVESRVYLFVFEKSGQQSHLQLYNHDLHKPHFIKIDLSSFKKIPDYRLDYAFNHAHNAFKSFLGESKQLGWTLLSDLATVYRGNIASPLGARVAIHTTSYSSGHWKLPKKVSRESKSTSQMAIHKGDILVKRVGRDCSSSYALSTGLEGYLCSDCVLLIRPKSQTCSIRLLFAMRSVFASNLGKILLERGTGASYITVRSLFDLEVPYHLSETHLSVYSAYTKAVIDRNHARMVELEKQIRSQLTFTF